MNMLKAALLASAITLAAGTAGAANLIVNGGFAGPNAPNGSFTTVSTSGVIPGWSLFGGNVDWITGYWQSSDGDGFSVDMDGTTQGAIGQYITTVVGKTYNLTFDMSGNPDAGADTDLLGVFANGFLSPNATYATGANTHANMGWSQRSYAFTANSTSTLIGFQSFNSNLCCYGAAIDNVSVSGAVPEPATWGMMILGFGAAGSMIRRRKAVSAAA